MADTPKTVCGILDRLTDIGDRNDRATIGDIVESFGSRSYGPVLLVPALITLLGERFWWPGDPAADRPRRPTLPDSPGDGQPGEDRPGRTGPPDQPKG